MAKLGPVARRLQQRGAFVSARVGPCRLCSRVWEPRVVGQSRLSRLMDVDGAPRKQTEEN